MNKKKTFIVTELKKIMPEGYFTDGFENHSVKFELDQGMIHIEWQPGVDQEGSTVKEICANLLPQAWNAEVGEALRALRQLDEANTNLGREAVQYKKRIAHLKAENEKLRSENEMLTSIRQGQMQQIARLQGLNEALTSIRKTDELVDRTMRIEAKKLHNPDLADGILSWILLPWEALKFIIMLPHLIKTMWIPSEIVWKAKDIKHHKNQIEFLKKLKQ